MNDNSTWLQVAYFTKLTEVTLCSFWRYCTVLNHPHCPVPLHRNHHVQSHCIRILLKIQILSPKNVPKAGPDQKCPSRPGQSSNSLRKKEKWGLPVFVRFHRSPHFGQKRRKTLLPTTFVDIVQTQNDMMAQTKCRTLKKMVVRQQKRGVWRQ